MTTLTINDLSLSEELGRAAMSEVRGGMTMGHYGLFPWYGHSDSSVKNFSFDAVQQINQGQQVGTNVNANVAVLGGMASPSVPVTAKQHADITNNVTF
ncbi:MAG: hypothetical protein ROZ37_14145 [Aromatoleum sp.]|jgi:hypothetical protein|uniref:hypothetical protein n=1 Tax=Aromatoleum sp. TaxID=2307007 RepID=UPI0028939B84|nr:hypothetical protein [Aromatoleum sp.]MDT3671457.1 hypothetical protein [Aromatoleum sp.]